MIKSVKFCREVNLENIGKSLDWSKRGGESFEPRHEIWDVFGRFKKSFILGDFLNETFWNLRDDVDVDDVDNISDDVEMLKTDESVQPSTIVDFIVGVNRVAASSCICKFSFSFPWKNNAAFSNVPKM